MFIGRTNELLALDDAYRSDKFEFIVIYGRRRVGKTALINRFINDKKAIYFMGVESNLKQNLNNFTDSILNAGGEDNTGVRFESFQSALEYVFKRSIKERLILAIDEYPYIARLDKSLSSTLQMLIDKYKDHSKLMLILCGSSMAYMEDRVLAYKAPLYDRRTAQMKIMPFDFAESCHYLADLSAEDKALTYGIVGGTPQYLLQIDVSLSVVDNIKKLFLNPHSALFEEPENLLKQELREPSLYNAIITAIANGSARLSEICDRVGIETNNCSAYLKNLLALGIVIKELPYGDNASRKALYSLSDNMFRFWYRFIPDHYSLIMRGASDLVYSRIEPFLTEYMGPIFEDIAQQYLWKQLLKGRCPVEFTSLGRWWGNDQKERKQVEIDIMGRQDKNTCLFGECKWTNEKVDLEVLERLIRHSELFPYKNKYYYLFAKNGFTKGCLDKAKALGNVALVTYKDILNDQK